MNARLRMPLFVLLLTILALGCSRQEDEAIYDPEKAAPTVNKTGAASQTPAANAAGQTENKDGQSLAGPMHVTMKTSMGTIEAELWPDKAPLTVANFVRYAREGHYNGTVFHRVVPGFVIQGGGYTPEMVEKPTHAPIKNEASNGLKNERGTLSMARTQDPDSATSQFFINLRDNQSLDPEGAVDGVGYAVFGRVTRGMDVVDRIARVKCTLGSDGSMSQPVEPVIIQSVAIREAAAGKEKKQ